MKFFQNPIKIHKNRFF